MENSFFSKFKPKEPKFFPLLESVAEVILEASTLMIEFIENGHSENAESYFHKIKEQELKGDIITNKIFDELNVSFITPFDREDIHMLASRMDDVTDYINSAAKRIYLYKPKEMPPGSKELAEIIKNGAETLVKSIDELDILKKSRKRVSQYASDLHVLENKADDIFDGFLINLFENQKDSVELIKQKEIMYELEKATDTIEDVGKIIRTIIVKYA